MQGSYREEREILRCRAPLSRRLEIRSHYGESLSSLLNRSKMQVSKKILGHRIEYWEQCAFLFLKLSNVGHAVFNFLGYLLNLGEKFTFKIDASLVFVIENPSKIVGGKRLIQH
jgi:hypothetical protein